MDLLSDKAKSTVLSFPETYFQGVRRFEPDQWTKNGAYQKKYPSLDGYKVATLFDSKIIFDLEQHQLLISF